MRDNSRMEFVEKWAHYCKNNMREAQRQLTPFINSQIENANKFYKRLAKTRGGKEKIGKIKRLLILKN